MLYNDYGMLYNMWCYITYVNVISHPWKYITHPNSCIRGYIACYITPLAT